MRFWMSTFLVLVHIILQCRASHTGLLPKKQPSAILKIVGMDQTSCTTDADCSHGYCDKVSKTCTCESGWTGKTCNELMAYKKIGKQESKDVKINRQKEEFNTYLIDMLSKINKKQRSRNHPFDVTPNLQQRKQPIPGQNLLRNFKKDPAGIAKPLPTVTVISEKPEKIQKVALEIEESDVCSDRYKYKTREERKCITGLECEFGSCSAVNYGSYIAFECKCDKGAKGLLCEQRCCKDCGSNGRCDFYPDGTQFCFCKRGFYGYRCQFSFSKISQKDHIPIVATSSSLQQQL